MDKTQNGNTIIYLFMSFTLCFVHGQHPDGTILLKQGAIIGVRNFLWKIYICIKFVALCVYTITN